MKNATIIVLLVVIVALLSCLVIKEFLPYMLFTQGDAGYKSKKTKLEVETLDGGSVITELSHDIKVNKNSSLHRKWVVINDAYCPVRIEKSGIATRYGGTYSAMGYFYSARGNIQTKEPIQAIEIRFVLYDVLGNYMDTLSTRIIEDIETDGVRKLTGSWDAWESQVSELLSVVSFVAQVRTTSGEIWKCNTQSIEKQLKVLNLKFFGKHILLEEEKEKNNRKKGGKSG